MVWDLGNRVVIRGFTKQLTMLLLYRVSEMGVARVSIRRLGSNFSWDPGRLCVLGFT